MDIPPVAHYGHVMPDFPWTLIDTPPLREADLSVTFAKHEVKAYDQAGYTILQGWHNPEKSSDDFLDRNEDVNQQEIRQRRVEGILLPPATLLRAHENRRRTIAKGYQYWRRRGI